jgi:DNA-binding IclR family transcriptional regulator
MIDELALRVLRAVHAGMESAVGLSVALNESPDKIRRSLDNLLALGLVECGPDGATGLRSTEAAAHLMASGGPRSRRAPSARRR